MEQQLKEANINAISNDYKKTKKLKFNFNGKAYSITLNKEKDVFVLLTISKAQPGQNAETDKIEIKKEDKILTAISTIINDVPIQ